MTRARGLLLMLAVVALTAPAPRLAAQAIDVPEIRMQFHDRPSVRIGRSFTLRAGDTAREVTVIGGDAVIEGRVDRDVVVVLGKVELGSTAVIGGSLVIVGGTGVVAEGAQVGEDLFVLGGFDAPAGFNPGGQYVGIGTDAIGGRLRGLVPWLTGGLLLGRPIVPGLRWVWGIAGFFFLLNLGLNLVFDTPVRASTATLRATPMSSFMTGLLVLLLVGPICLLLAVSVVGLAVVPFVICALLFAAIIGRIGFARWIGMSVVGQDDAAGRLQSLRSFLIGSAIICVAYMAPILGLLTWTLAGVFGLGAATLAFFSAYRRENPRRPRPARATAAAAAPEPAAFVEPAAADPERPQSAAAAADPLIEVSPPAPAEAPRPVMLPRAPFLDRLAALVLDVIVVIIAVQVLGLDTPGEGPFGRGGLLIALAYHVGFWTWKGTTLGGIICQLRVVRVDGMPLRFAEALVRGLAGFFSLAVLGLGFFWILRDPQRQAWHDIVAGTYVVKVPREWPI